jgi:hypothetical protein
MWRVFFASSMILQALGWVSHIPLIRQPTPLRKLVSRWSSMEENIEGSPVVVRCLETKRVIECLIDGYFGDERGTYFVLHACDDLVAIAKHDDDGPILIDSDSEEMDQIFPVASALFKEDGIDLIRSASCLTMHRDFGDFDIDDETGEVGDHKEEDDREEEEEAMTGKENESDDDSGNDEGDFDDSLESAPEIIGDFEIEDKPYSLVQFTEPMFLVARKSSDSEFGDEYELLNATENARIAPLFQETISKILEMEGGLVNDKPSTKQPPR